MLTKAFDTARLERLRAIEDKKQCTPTDYTFTKAMADVFDYHTSCSITTGLMQAQEAVEQQRSPNIETLTKLAEQIAAARVSFAKLDPPATQSQPTTQTSAPSGAGGTVPSTQTGQGAATQTTRNSGSADSATTAPSTGAGAAATGTGAGTSPAATRPPTCPLNAAQTQAQVQK